MSWVRIWSYKVGISQGMFNRTVVEIKNHRTTVPSVDSARQTSNLTYMQWIDSMLRCMCYKEYCNDTGNDVSFAKTWFNEPLQCLSVIAVFSQQNCYVRCNALRSVYITKSLVQFHYALTALFYDQTALLIAPQAFITHTI